MAHHSLCLSASSLDHTVPCGRCAGGRAGVRRRAVPPPSQAIPTQQQLCCYHVCVKGGTDVLKRIGLAAVVRIALVALAACNTGSPPIGQDATISLADAHATDQRRDGSAIRGHYSLHWQLVGLVVGILGVLEVLAALFNVLAGTANPAQHLAAGGIGVVLILVGLALAGSDRTKAG